MHKGATGKLFGLARENRQNSTQEEKILWPYLRSRRLQGYKFRRQHPIASFIVDFYCHEARLAIEIDGQYHLERDQKDYDIGRTYELEKLGIRVVRFTNQEVKESLNTVLEKIKQIIIESKNVSLFQTEK